MLKTIKLKYIAYCRKSSEEENRQAQSLETQSTRILKTVDEENLEVVSIYEESKSARYKNRRPKFMLMLKQIKRGEANTIIVNHTDRLTRNLSEGALLLELIDSGKIKEVRTPNRVYSSDVDFTSLITDIAEATKYSRKLSHDVCDGNTTKLKRGEWLSVAPLGYKNKDKSIAPYKKKAPFIVKAFQMYASGLYNLKEIANTLYDEGFRTKLGNKVHKAVIHRILTNPVYYGYIRSKGELYKGSYKALVSKELFDKVQDVLSGKNRVKRQKHDFIFRDYLTCAECGCKITASTKKGIYRYYYCTNGKGKCTQRAEYIKECDLDDIIGNMVQNFELDKEWAELSFDHYLSDLQNKAKTEVTNIPKHDKRIKEIDDELDGLAILAARKKISEDSLERSTSKLEIERNQLLESQKNAPKPHSQRTLELLRKVKFRACNAKKEYDTRDEKIRKDLLDSLLWNLQIKNKEIATIQYKEPYTIVERHRSKTAP